MLDPDSVNISNDCTENSRHSSLNDLLEKLSVINFNFYTKNGINGWKKQRKQKTKTTLKSRNRTSIT